MEAPIPRHWCAGDPFRTALFNALSMSFPVGEQFFIDAVRNGLQALPLEKQAAFRTEAQGFIGQEATHSRLHSLYNANLERLGLENKWEARIRERLKELKGSDLRHAAAITATYEHFTAILADWLMNNPDLLGDQDERLRTLWLWHCAEESEHKSTAFDLYKALGGNYEWRIRWFRRITVIFICDTIRQTANNLRRDRTLWKWITWKSAASFLFGRRGLVRELYRPWRDYLRANFHPEQQDSHASERWLAQHGDVFAPVGAPL
jgi:predicted metal-dependent hydrolase